MSAASSYRFAIVNPHFKQVPILQGLRGTGCSPANMRIQLFLSKGGWAQKPDHRDFLSSGTIDPAQNDFITKELSS
jgi:hypothetical protein